MRIIPFVLCCTSVWALPRDPIITEGTAQFIKQEKGLHILADDRTIIGWDDFSIDIDEWTQFDLPSQKAIVLNRVFSNQQSQILGKLTSNGQILLINPNGILVGKEASLDMASFMATTLDVCDDAFTSKGDLVLQGKHSDSTVQNLGTIKAFDGDVFLIGWNVDNKGTIEAPNGIAAAIASGNLIIRPEGSERIYIKPQIISQNAYSGAFIHEGNEDALEIEELNGQIQLKGSIKAKEVLVLGDWIDASNLSIDAPAGTVHIGGGPKGQNENYSNAKHVYLDPSVAIHADGVGEADGGEVIVWSDGHTHFLGNISARGKNGGFVEVSGKNYLDYQGFVDLQGSSGVNGTLLLDPTDIIITTAVVGGVFNPLAPCNLCGVGAVCQSNLSTTIQDTTLVAQLGASNVLLDATVAGGGGNTITVNPNANIYWNGANSLGLIAANAITIRASLQNTGTGNVSIQSTNGPIVIDASFSTIANEGARVGSQNGTTTVCSPNANLTLQGSNTQQSAGAQIGYNRSAPGGVPLGGVTANGPIVVQCNNLLLQNSNSFRASGAQIGHGQMDVINIAVQTSNINAPITVTAGNIDLNVNPATLQTVAVIGHGCNSQLGTLRGDINVTSNGNVSLLFNRGIGGIGQGSSRIGHGPGSGSIGFTIAVSGNITVQAVGNVTLTDSPAGLADSNICIGHEAGFVGLLQSDVTVISGGTVSMIGAVASSAGGSRRMSIGNLTISAAGAGPYRSNTRVSACLDLIMTVNNESLYSLGMPFNSVAPGGDFGNVEVAVGRDIIITANGTGAGGSGAGFIGNNWGSQAGTVSRTFVAAGRNITISGTQNVGIRAFGDVNVASGGNVTVTALGANTSYIGTDRVSLIPGSTTRVYAVGNVIATNSAASRAIIGRALLTGATYSNSLEIRAGGDINLSAPITTASLPTSGSVFLEADTNLPVGSLWTSAGGFVNSVDTIVMTNPTGGAALPIQLSPTCPASKIFANSTIITADGLGGLSFNTGTFGGNILLSTTAGNITLHSAAKNAAGALQSVTVGTAANNPNILTTSGNIDISGSNATDSLLDVIINNNGTAGQGLQTSGSIFVRANRNLTVNPNSSIVTTGAKNVTLTAGNDPLLIGILAINSDVTSAGGNILLQSGATTGCSSRMSGSSINHLAGTINPGSGNLTANANFNINLSSPAVPSMTTSTGTFHTLAGNDTTLTNTTLSKTAAGGDLLMISGHTMTMTNSHIDGTLTIVTLVVDNCFPVSPLIGPGAFIMDAPSTILGDPRIFTALRPQNTISGTLNGSPFVPGVLFQDTATEVWCTYFAFPFPYPFPNLGLPYTIFYKNCVGPISNQANIIVSQFLIDLHPFNEFPGWLEEFYFMFRGQGTEIASSMNVLENEPFYIRRRELKLFNLPKYYTIITNDTYLERTRDGELRVGD